MSHPPPYTSRMKNIIIEHQHAGASADLSQPPLSLTPCFSKVRQPLGDPLNGFNRFLRLVGVPALKTQISNMKLSFELRLPKSKIQNRKSKIR
jgi:hypothetical protein